MIITLTGSNSFALRQRLSGLTREFVAEQGELALERIEAGSTDLQGIIEAVQGLPFLATRKMVVLRDLSANKPAAEAIEQIISSVEQTTDLIIYEPAPDKRTSYFKVLKGQTELEEFNEMEAHALAGWLAEEAKNGGGQLSQSDANYLVERVGASQQMLSSELAKLLTYDPQISRANIDLLTDQAPQSKIFELLDAVFGDNKGRALKLYEEQRAQRVEPQAILAMIAWQLQLLAVAKYSKDKSAAEVAREAGVSPYPVTKAKNLAGRITGAKLNKMVDEALNIDWRSKTTAIDLDEALKTYLITL